MSIKVITHGAALAALIVLLGNGQVWAQRTCSDFTQECISHPKIKNPQSCVGAKARCMKTGRFIGTRNWQRLRRC